MLLLLLMVMMHPACCAFDCVRRSYQHHLGHHICANIVDQTTCHRRKHGWKTIHQGPFLNYDSHWPAIERVPIHRPRCMSVVPRQWQVMMMVLLRCSRSNRHNHFAAAPLHRLAEPCVSGDCPALDGARQCRLRLLMLTRIGSMVPHLLLAVHVSCRWAG